MILYLYFFFFNDTATTEIYTLSLHDALPIYNLLLIIVVGHRLDPPPTGPCSERRACGRPLCRSSRSRRDRKSTRLNSSHANISYAVFCLKKKTMDADRLLKA